MLAAFATRKEGEGSHLVRRVQASGENSAPRTDPPEGAYFFVQAVQ